MNGIKISDVNPDAIKYDSYINQDVTTDQCFNVYVGDTNVYQKDKNIQNCWIDYNLVTVEPLTAVPGRNFIKINKLNGTKLPNVTDLEKHILPSQNSGVEPILWNTQIKNSITINKLVNYLNTHDVVFVNADTTNYSSYTTDDNNIIEYNWFSGLSDYIDHLTIKFNGAFTYLVLNNLFNYTNIGKLTLQFMQDNLRISSANTLFRQCGVKELEILDKNGNIAYEVDKQFITGNDVTAIREGGYSLKVFPPIIKWESRSSDKYSHNKIQYSFSYDSVVEEIQERPQYSREHDNNTIKCYQFSAQAFENCSNLKRIGPRLFMSYIIPGTNTTSSGAYRMFYNCSKLEDVLLYGLNAGVWRFNNNSYAGNIPALSEQSIQYLFTNLLDLTTYDPTMSDSAQTSFLTDWTYGWTYTNSLSNSKEIGMIYTDMRLPNTWPDLFAETTTVLDNVGIIVSNLQEGDKLTWTGSDLDITTDGTYQISGAGGFRLVNDNISDNQTYRGENIIIRLVKPYDPAAPKGDSGELHCPQEWQSKITDDMVQNANAKGWKVYINNSEI